MHVYVARFDLRIPGSRSLKQKRGVVKTLTASLRSTFAVSVAEVGYHDLWQRTAIGVAVVGSEGHHLRRLLHEIERAIDRRAEVEVIDRQIHAFGLED